MTVTSAHLEKACEKLLQWCSVEFRGMRRDTSLEVPDELSEAVRRLRLRPERLLYVAHLLRFHIFPFLITISPHQLTHPPSEVLTVLAKTRQSTFLTSFTSALTTGNRTGSVLSVGSRRPIDLHAHDVLRYIYDMTCSHGCTKRSLRCASSSRRFSASTQTRACQAPYGHQPHAEDEWLGTH
jgi:hypothetical protein